MDRQPIMCVLFISFSRYVAVHYPLDYSQAMNDKFALRQRMVRYLLPVFFLSLLFNITKFFEAEFFFGKLFSKVCSRGSPVSNILPRFDLKYRMLRTCSTASTGLDFLDITESYTNLENSCYKHEIIFMEFFCKVAFNTL